MLIYLTASARQRALNALERMLTAKGLLAVGHAEPQSLADRAFRRVGPESLFLFSRKQVSDMMPIATSHPIRSRHTTMTASVSTVSVQTPVPKSAPNENLLVGARQFADGGQLEEALQACQAHLRAVGPSAEAYSLVGLIQQARGDTTATAEAFRKSLYLDPDNRDALTYTMLNAARQGEASRAAELRDRLARTKGEEHQ